jgi:hypothetical protein
MTFAELTAAINAKLASGQPITAVIHRSAEGDIIAELYNANSRGAVLAGVSQQVSFSGGDELLVVRSGATIRIPYTGIAVGQNRGAADISGDAYPTNGSGVAGAVVAGDWWYVSVTGNLDLGIGAEPVPVKSILLALVNAPGQTPASWRVI